MRPASPRRNARSCVSKNSVPSNRRSCSSSQAMASMSRWLVGSSSSSISGSPTSARARSTRRWLPIDSERNSAAPSRPPRSSTCSTRCSSRHASPVASSARPTRPAATTSRTGPQRSVGTSWGRKPICMPLRRITSPLSGFISPANSRSSVVLPSPLRPSRHSRSPFSTLRSTWSRTDGPPSDRQTVFNSSRAMRNGAPRITKRWRTATKSRREPT